MRRHWGSWFVTRVTVMWVVVAFTFIENTAARVAAVVVVVVIGVAWITEAISRR